MEKSKTTKREVFTKTGFILALVFCATPYVSAPIALVGGFLFTLFFGHPYAKLNHKATNILLKASVVGLGFGMNVQSALQVGREGLGLTVASITTVLILGYLVGGWLKMPRKSSHLVASGTAICGGSAIAAVAPAVNASEKEISVSLGVVFLLNAVALVVFPFIGHLLGLSQHQFGLWSAIAIHDTSSVVGAASAYGNAALDRQAGTRLVDNSRITPLRLPIQEQGKENLDTVVHPLLHPRHAGQQLPARYQYRRTGDNGHIEIGSRRNALPDRCRTVGRKNQVGWLETAHTRHHPVDNGLHPFAARNHALLGSWI